MGWVQVGDGVGSGGGWGGFRWGRDGGGRMVGSVHVGWGGVQVGDAQVGVFRWWGVVQVRGGSVRLGWGGGGLSGGRGAKGQKSGGGENLTESFCKLSLGLEMG